MTDMRLAMRGRRSGRSHASRRWLVAATLLGGVLSGCGAATSERAPADSTADARRQRERFEQERWEMVRYIAAEGVTDSATLAAMRAVPRDEFVPREFRKEAYADRALPIEAGATISQPHIVAVMTQEIRPRPGMKVLEVGTGSGYQAALLAHIGCTVYTIELVEELAENARARLVRLGYGDVQVRHGDGYLGWPEAAPFDGILVTAAPDTIPRPLVEQLAPGGRLVIPVGRENQVQWLTLIERDRDGELRKKALLPVRFIPMREGPR
jgi:protein-L-isoaspartate(D-aspartate) O-methyltransferase